MKKTKNSRATNPVFNLVVFKAAFQIDAIYVQRGLNKYSDWSAQMIQDICEDIKPWLSPIWTAIENKEIF